MTISHRIAFHPVIAKAYSGIHDWLSQREDAPDYRKHSARNRVDKLLDEKSFESAAVQYYVLFPAHFFKVAHALRYSIGEAKLLEWLEFTPRVCIVDVGCGAGAGSAAFLQVLLRLADRGLLKHQISVYCIGVDINEYALALYNQFLSQIRRRTKGTPISLEFHVIPYGDLRAINHMRTRLNNRLKEWEQPYLSHLFVMQVNVVSPFSDRFRSTSEKYDDLVTLDITTDPFYQESFGREEAAAYKQILEDVAVDHLHIITVGTRGFEEEVQEMANAIDYEFRSHRHQVDRLASGKHEVFYYLPEDCYWVEHKNSTQYSSPFHLDISTISNTALEDEDWNAVKNTENLRLAWARARHHLLQQQLVDEVEIRLFERDLEANLVRLQRQLNAYAQDVARTDDRIHFKIPKDLDAGRPLALSRIEEEILATALIQQLGQRVAGIANRSFAYKFSRGRGERENEYLYEYWLVAYKKYISRARDAANRHEDCAVIQTDIKSFYTRIVPQGSLKF